MICVLNQQGESEEREDGKGSPLGLSFELSNEPVFFIAAALGAITARRELVTRRGGMRDRGLGASRVGDLGDTTRGFNRLARVDCLDHA